VRPGQVRVDHISEALCRIFRGLVLSTVSEVQRDCEVNLGSVSLEHVVSWAMQVCRDPLHLQKLLYWNQEGRTFLNYRLWWMMRDAQRVLIM